MNQAPFAHIGIRIPQMMQAVLLALLPAWLFAIWQFGIPALLLSVSCVVAALLCEVICLKLNPKGQGSIMDGSALITALILAMSLPPHAPLWVGAIGSALAVAVGKHCYGGLGQNLFNPAMFARVVLLIAFPVEMTHWPVPDPNYWTNLIADSMTTATPLATEGVVHTTSLLSSFMGTIPGSLGETSGIALIIGGLYLLWRRVITYPLVISSLLGCFVPAAIAWIFGMQGQSEPWLELTNGAILFAAFFIVTDPVTAPSSPKGQWMYGILFGVLVWLIRHFANYPEGVAFAILLCNAVNPLIEHYTRPVIYGHATSRRRS
ncbi:RnfABCDGE type electron transport complex subunit D [Celerinatantimonas sp. YJH-8]|uniref:RnfABCDGE type electron transport complex subunit D n=1 Tax=Celerinatantimonas sp. YJH-8 TaxID=3228714 RepID=UPI0038BF1EB0